jgi:hypothetical protein
MCEYTLGGNSEQQDMLQIDQLIDVQSCFWMHIKFYSIVKLAFYV